MKKILLFMSMALLMIACDKKEPDLSKGKLDPNAMITIKAGAVTKSGINGWGDGNALDVVKQALNIKWNTHYGDNVYSEEVRTIGRSFAEAQRDLDTPALKMWGTDIINQDGEYVKDFTHAFNVVFTDNNNDTIAYVPDEVINEARPLIEKAYNEKDYTEVYRLFDEAFMFIPIIPTLK